MSSPLVTIEANSSVEAAADIIIQSTAFASCNGYGNRPLGIITPTNFTAYLKENLNMDDVIMQEYCKNIARILQFL
jgi:CBS domain-containing protein